MKNFLFLCLCILTALVTYITLGSIVYEYNDLFFISLPLNLLLIVCYYSFYKKRQKENL